MKIIILIAVCTMLFTSSFCQAKMIQHSPKEKYLRASKVHKIIGFTFLGGAVTFYTASSIIIAQQQRDNPGGLNFGGIGEMILGTLCLVSSIPFLLISSHFKRKALAITFSNQKYIVPDVGFVAVKPQPTLSIKLKF